MVPVLTGVLVPEYTQQIICSARAAARPKRRIVFRLFSLSVSFRVPSSPRIITSTYLVFRSHRSVLFYFSPKLELERFAPNFIYR